MSGDPTAEESKSPNIVKINLKMCDPESIKPTAFFTDQNPESILTEIITYLEESETPIPFEISNNGSKISYKKAREGKVEEGVDGELIFNEQAEISIQL